MQFAAAQFFCGDSFACGSFDKWRTSKEDRSLPAHDDRLVAHGRHISTACSARAHHHSNLRDAARAHVRLVKEDAAKVVAIRKDLILIGKVRATGIHQIDARQMVFSRDFLCTKMFLHGHRIIGAALDGRVIGKNHNITARDTPHTGNRAAGRHITAVQPVRRKKSNFQKRRSWIEKRLNAIPRKHLTTCKMPFPRLRNTTTQRVFRCLPHHIHLRLHGRAILRKVF